MLTKKQIKEIKEQLDNSQSPLFFFDNDADGFCSFLLLRRHVGRGKGIPVKSFPELNADYFQKVLEFNADCIFILDKPVVADDFFEEARKMNIPIVWIDHHSNDKKIPEFVRYYNPLFSKNKKNEPVTYLCYQITEKKDLWIALVGCIADNFIPDFYKDFKKLFPDLIDENLESAFDIFYNSQIGKIARIFNFALKDRTTNVMKMIKFLTNVASPYEVLDETSVNYTMHKRFKEINRKIEKLLKKAENEESKNNLLFFEYSGELSLSADLSNELIYKFPDKMIIVVYVSSGKANISGRGRKIKDVFLKATKGLENATAGGHENAAGAKIQIKDIEKFRERVEELVSKNSN